MNERMDSYVEPRVEVYAIGETGVICTSGSTQNYTVSGDVTDDWFTK